LEERRALRNSEVCGGGGGGGNNDGGALTSKGSSGDGRINVDGKAIDVARFGSFSSILACVNDLYLI
jgi:hypothetical protein